VDANIVLNASLLDILFGKFDLEKDFLLVNHILFYKLYYYFITCLLVSGEEYSNYNGHKDFI